MSDRSIRITLIRHGESVANRTQRWQGQGDSPLSELGSAQARALGKRMKGRAFDLIVASDLERASATARALERSFERDAAFREFDIGAWEGLTREEVLARYPEELARLEAGEDIALGGGESYEAFCARVDGAFTRLRARLEPGQHALVVCHGGVIGVLVSAVLGLRKVRELPIGRAINTSISELSFAPDGAATLHVFNDSLHLSELSLFPHPVEMARALALVCGQAPHAAYGAFAAHYDAELHLDDLWRDASAAERNFASLHQRVCARHPEHRVALSAAAESIRRWVGETLGGEAEPRVGLPFTGALCHVTAGPKRLLLLDYGVSV